MIPMIYLASMGLLGVATAAKHYRDKKASFHGVSTPERQVVYETAMNHVQDVDKLNALAAEYEKQGLHDQAAMLRKRAILRNLPQEVKDARKDVFKRALNSTNKQAVRQIAQAFYGEGAMGAAEKLFEYADGLPDK